MRGLLYLAALGALIAAGFWLLQRYRAGGQPQLPQRPPPARLPTALTGEIEETASIVYGPDRGPGLLRLTPTQLVFSGSSGRVVVLERMAITGVGVSRQLPDRTAAQPVLVVTTDTETCYFAIASPQQWESRLT